LLRFEQSRGMLSRGFQLRCRFVSPPQPTESARREHRKLPEAPIGPALAEQQSGGLDSGERRFDPAAGKIETDRKLDVLDLAAEVSGPAIFGRRGFQDLAHAPEPAAA